MIKRSLILNTLVGRMCVSVFNALPARRIMTSQVAATSIGLNIVTGNKLNVQSDPYCTDPFNEHIDATTNTRI